MSPRSVDAAARASTSTSPDSDLVDLDFEYLINVMKEDKSKIWSSVELHDIYSKVAEGNFHVDLLCKH